IAGAKKVTTEMDQTWKRFTENVQRNLGDVLYDNLNGKFTDIADLFKQMLLRMAADAAAANITQSPLGVDPVPGLTDAGAVAYGGSYAGGGFTGYGSRSGDIDGRGGFPAILHPNETV